MVVDCLLACLSWLLLHFKIDLYITLYHSRIRNCFLVDSSIHTMLVLFLLALLQHFYLWFYVFFHCMLSLYQLSNSWLDLLVIHLLLLRRYWLLVTSLPFGIIIVYLSLSLLWHLSYFLSSTPSVRWLHRPFIMCLSSMRMSLLLPVYYHHIQRLLLFTSLDRLG